MSGPLIGYARVAADERDLTSQRDALARLGVATKRVYVDHGLVGTNRPRPGLREAIAACRAGDTFPFEVQPSRVRLVDMTLQPALSRNPGNDGVARSRGDVSG